MSLLYKYLPPERETYLSDSLLRFTPPSALNDPYECLPGITEELENLTFQYFEEKLSAPPEHLKELKRKERRIEKRNYEKNLRITLKNIQKTPDIINDYFYTQAAKKMNMNLGILSLSKRWDSALMWSHYTESHQGFCIGFNENHEYFRKDSSKANMGDFIIEPITYSEERPMVPNQRPSKSL